MRGAEPVLGNDSALIHCYSGDISTAAVGPLPGGNPADVGRWTIGAHDAGRFQAREPVARCPGLDLGFQLVAYTTTRRTVNTLSDSPRRLGCTRNVGVLFADKVWDSAGGSDPEAHKRQRGRAERSNRVVGALDAECSLSREGALSSAHGQAALFVRGKRGTGGAYCSPQRKQERAQPVAAAGSHATAARRALPPSPEL